MVVSRDTCSICVKPFYGKQKSVHCGTSGIRFHSVCMQLGEAGQPTVTVAGESAFTCDACVTSLSSSNTKDLASSTGSTSLPPEDDKPHPTLNTEYAISTVSTQLEAVHQNGQSTLHLIEFLVGMVNKLTEEVAYLKNDNACMKEEIESLHRLIVAAPGPYAASELRIPPAVTKDTVTTQLVPLSAPSITTLLVSNLPAVPTTATMGGLSYRDDVATGSSPTDAEGFKTVKYKRKTQAKLPPADIVAVSTVRHRRQPLIGVHKSPSLPVIAKKERTKALFVSRFSPKVTADDVHKSLKEQLSLKKLVCTRLRTKFNTYASFHITVTEDEFSLINDVGVWPSGCLIAPYYGKLAPDQVFTPSTSEAGMSDASVKSAVNPAGNDVVDLGCSTSI
ncbi:uncharacterized protein LOC111872200 [Cryptotermes secundus]|uniref:uncharacterized protein LOC111872200 n=1 Tax=Cryptotermes secundus TaxID=105785 RepID=UPI001454BC55|nr:uncharacterized protein LOC111872200 [Cryptotermes secundus]XP_033610481.1 uncharacterized protein LOC111872200 [Cryptotermes secundus]XP_033610482.1 uncharacterized protein LOC111872200 [Cryptotermes secundus]